MTLWEAEFDVEDRRHRGGCRLYAARRGTGRRGQEVGERGGLAHQRGSCDVSGRRGDAVVTCDVSEGTGLRYRFRIPRDAHHFRARVDRNHRGCCGRLVFSSSRFGTLRRHLVVEVRVRNYGSPLGHYKGIICEVEVRYWTALA